MKRYTKYLLLLAIMGTFSFSAHKFYTAIYQLDFVPKKQQLQVTARIFNDDLNEALAHRFQTAIFLGTEKETPKDIELLKKYLAEKFIITVNGKSQPLHFHSKELEDNVLICYLSYKPIAKISSLQVENTLLTEMHPEQQNIIQANLNGKKTSLLLDGKTFKGMLK